jgi:hypothetical protein
MLPRPTRHGLPGDGSVPRPNAAWHWRGRSSSRARSRCTRCATPPVALVAPRHSAESSEPTSLALRPTTLSTSVDATASSPRKHSDRPRSTPRRHAVKPYASPTRTASNRSADRDDLSSPAGSAVRRCARTLADPAPPAAQRQDSGGSAPDELHPAGLTEQANHHVTKGSCMTPHSGFVRFDRISLLNYMFRSPKRTSLSSHSRNSF